MASLAELEDCLDNGTAAVFPDEITTTLEEYVQTGAAVSGRVVVWLIKNATGPFTPDLVQRIHAAAVEGAVDQYARGFHYLALQYLMVAAAVR